MRRDTQLAPGLRLGRYELLGRIGSGGMGDVYRAIDTRLDRIVAVKILSAEGEDPTIWRARFEREARAISKLNHPNICTVYDIGCEEGTDFIVMEYLDGETLAKRLERGPLALSQVLRHGIEICGALSHAHRNGFVHRDVKPSNIVLTAVGAKLLDFGIAKNRPLQGDEPGDGQNTSQLSVTLTLEGVLIGTVQYMAPEQLEGFGADARTDIFAMGLVLFEMAAGRPAFEGRSAASVIAKVLSSDPAPANIHDLSISRTFDSTIKRCLAKAPEERWQNIEDLKSELQWMSETLSAGQSAALIGERPSQQASKYLPLARFFVDPPPDHTFVKFGTQSALSPDGKYLAFVASSPEGRSRLWLRPLETPAARELPDTDGAAGPFWSPDSRDIAFFTKGTLRKIAISDGRSEVIGDAPTGTLGSGAWNTAGAIIMGSPDTGLFQLSASGGKIAPLTRVDRAKQDRGHTNPQFLPDGRHFIFLLRTNDAERAGIYLAAIEAPEQQTHLVKAQLKAEYVDPGYLIFVRDRNLCAQPFDMAVGRPTGAAKVIAERVAFNEASGRASFSTSHHGVLSYHAAGTTELVWFDRAGRQLGTIAVNDFDANPAISPDGTLVAFSAVEPKTGKQNLWINEVSMNRLRRITDDERGNDIAPVWSPDGRRIAFASDRAGSFSLYVTSLDGGAEELIFSSAEDNWPLDWSRDGQFLLFRRGADFRQLWALPLTGGSQPFLLASSTPSVAVAQLSPDGRWLAYVSGETGKEEVFIRAFPSGERRIQVSQEGGAEPIWEADGRELVYLTRKGGVMAVPVTLAETIEIGHPVPLFQTRLVGSSSVGTLARNQYDMTSDGQRFLINLPKQDPSAIPITVVVNWLNALR